MTLYVSLLLVPTVFSLYVLVLYPGKAAFAPPLSSHPLPPLRSAFAVSGSAIGWVSLGMVGLTLLASLIGIAQALTSK